MNHTQRIAHVTRQKRYLTKAVVREEIELYLEALADDIAEGDWVDIKDIAKVRVSQEDANIILQSFSKTGIRTKRKVLSRIRTQIRLSSKFKYRVRNQN